MVYRGLQGYTRDSRDYRDIRGFTRDCKGNIRDYKGIKEFTGDSWSIQKFTRD